VFFSFPLLIKDYKSPVKMNSGESPAANRGGERRKCFLSPPQLMDRMRHDFLDATDADGCRKGEKRPLQIPPEKRQLYSHILKEINRRIMSQSFSLTIS